MRSAPPKASAKAAAPAAIAAPSGPTSSIAPAITAPATTGAAVIRTSRTPPTARAAIRHPATAETPPAARTRGDPQPRDGEDAHRDAHGQAGAGRVERRHERGAQDDVERDDPAAEA